MHFNLVDRVLERDEGRIVTLKQVSNAEEYLQDHFPGFAVLPGVMMIESAVQAARVLLGEGPAGVPMVLGSVRALKYGRFVRPGQSLRVEVRAGERSPDGRVECRAEGRVVDPTTGAESGEVAFSGRIVMRPTRIGRCAEPARASVGG